MSENLKQLSYIISIIGRIESGRIRQMKRINQGAAFFPFVGKIKSSHSSKTRLVLFRPAETLDVRIFYSDEA